MDRALNLTARPQAGGDTEGPALRPRILTPHPAIGRASAAFVMGFLREAAVVSGGDFVDAVIRMAILDANTRHILADGAANRRYAAFDQGLPDELRRPLSIHGLSMSLSLPFETVRRRVHRLVARGLCSLADGGLLITEAQLAAEPFRAFNDRVLLSVRKLHSEVRAHSADFGPLGADDGGGLTAAASPPPVRIVARAALSYVLRYVESAERVAGSLLDGAVFLFTFTLNVENPVASPRSRTAAGGDGEIMSDDLRRRVPVFALARAMNLSPETLRRRVKALAAMGLFIRDERGVYIPAAVLSSAAVRDHRDRNLASLQRLFSDLQRAGVRLP